MGTGFSLSLAIAIGITIAKITITAIIPIINPHLIYFFFFSSYALSAIDILALGIVVDVGLLNVVGRSPAASVLLILPYEIKLSLEKLIRAGVVIITNVYLLFILIIDNKFNIVFNHKIYVID